MSYRMDWHGGEVTKKYREAAAETLQEMAEGVLTEANKTVPHDEGDLEGSGTPSVDVRELVAAVSYDTPYATKLHESEPGEYSFRGNGRRKWLEQTINEMSGQLEKFAADEMRKRL